MRASRVMLRRRTKLAFDEKRPVTYHKKKRLKKRRIAAGDTVYTPGLNSPLRYLVDETRALPLDFWEAKHREGKLHHYTKEELAENKARAEARAQVRADKREKKAREREAVAQRARMLEQLEKDKQGQVAVFMEEERKKAERRMYKFID